MLTETSEQPAAQECGGGPRLIFACSGAADVGAVADLVARRMTRDGEGRMFCLAGVGGRVESIMRTTEEAERILAIDGCPLNCVRETLKLAGFTDFRHMVVTDLGLEKGRTPVTSEIIEMVAAKGAEMMDGEAM